VPLLFSRPALTNRRPLRNRYEIPDRAILRSDRFLDQPHELGNVTGRALTHQAAKGSSTPGVAAR
jgi:hypothetical protein